MRWLHNPRPHRALLWRAVGLVLALGVLLAVFSLYTEPDFFFTVANQVWACF